MAPNQSPPEPRPHRGYETRDVKLSAVLWLLFAIVATAAITAPGLYFLFQRFQASAARRDPRLSPLLDPDQIPPAPRLQSTPNADYSQYIAEQNQRLESYGWVDRGQKRVRIPVTRAIDLLAERGLPEPASIPATEVEPNQPEGASDASTPAESSTSTESRASDPPAEPAAAPPPSEDRS